MILYTKNIYYVYKMKKCTLLILLLSISLLSFSQNKTLQKKEVFSKDVFISKKLSGTIKLYDNGTTAFTPFDQKIIDAYFEEIQYKHFSDTMKIFTENWNTEQLFPYGKIDLSAMTDTVMFEFDPKTFYCTPDAKLNSPFGPRRGRQHKGIDTDLDTGDTLKAMFNGKVRYAKDASGYGNLVIIRHHNGLETYYAHLSKILVEPGDVLKAGVVIGLGGETGNALGPHLHFEIRYKDHAFDPEKVIDLKNQCLKSTTLYLTKEDFGWQKQWTEKSGKKYHKVKRGDTLIGIAKKNNTSVKQILKINTKLKITSILKIGQTIRVK